MVNALIRAFAEEQYAGTWTYLTQAVNGYALGLNELGYFIRLGLGVAFVALFVRPLDDKLCWHVVCPLNLSPLEVCDICLRLSDALDAPIYLKKLKPPLLIQLARLPGFCDAATSPWHPQAPLEDDTYPEQVARIDYALELLNTSSSEVATKIRRFERKVPCHRLTWQELSEPTTPRKVIRQFFGYKRAVHIDISQPSDYENMLVHPSPRPHSDVIRYLLSIDSLPLALIIMERIGSSGVFGLYCSIALYQRFPYLSEVVVAQTFRLAADCGGIAVNLGGSESKGLNHFKAKFGTTAVAPTPGWLIFVRPATN